MSEDTEEAGPLIQMAEWLELDDMLVEPPPRIWLAKHGDDGIIPMGEVGLVVGAGGTSKTYLMISLVVSVALGKPWLDKFTIANPGNAAIFLAEETKLECRRRFYYVCKQMKLSRAELELACRRVLCAPLSGVPTRLVDSKTGGISADANGLGTYLSGYGSRGPWQLIVFDSLSRFGGEMTEKDNAAAAEFVRIAEQFAHLPGGPAIAIVHHTSLSARNPNSDVPITPRGVTALHDNCRWVVTLHPDVETNQVSIRVSKSNYGPTYPVVPETVLRRGDHGALAVVPEDELEAEREAREAENRIADEDTVYRECQRHPGRHTTKTELATACRGRKRDMLAAIGRLLEQGRIMCDEEGFRTSSWTSDDGS